MGEVYRARDTRLGRDVALKILPDNFASDPERAARFKREAQILAALDHPHIAAIHGLEVSGPTQFLVLELVDGGTLADRLTRGALPVAEAIQIARQIADALAAAHEKGIIHRDLKPANIALTANDQVKVLDFGLAKAMESGAGNREAGSGNLANSPTLTSPAAMTQAGMILGTAAYMSPEQAKGRVADKRTDVWAFGCVLYEMLTGRTAFPGDDVLDTLTAVMRAEPNWSALPAETPADLRMLLEKCLKKDRKERIADIAVVQFLLDTRSAPSTSDAPAIHAPVVVVPAWRRLIVPVGMAIAGALVGVALWSLRAPGASPPTPITRFALALGEGEQFTGGGRQQIAISPDGTRVVYAANNRLYLRSMSELAGKAIPGTDLIGGAWNPVFSPDGLSIVFGTPFDNALKRVSIDGGALATVVATESGYALGIGWSPDGIVFVEPGSRNIRRVSPNGGTPETLVTRKAAEFAYGPQMLPGGETLIFTLATAKGTGADTRGIRAGPSIWDGAKIVAQSLKSGDRKVLIDGGSDGRYLPTGHLVFARGGVLFAVPFDRRKVEVTGAPVPVLEGVRRSVGDATGAAQFSVSDTGSLVYVTGPANRTSAQLDLGLIDQAGGVTPLNLPPAAYDAARVSPDGTQIAVGSDDGKEAIISIVDLSGARSVRRLTFGGNSRFPIWSVDGRRVAFQSDRDGDLGIFWQPADGQGAAERLTTPDQKGTSHIPESWSPRGDTLLFRATKDRSAALWTLSMATRKMAAFGDVRSPVPTDAVFSPDGRWVAYAAQTTTDQERGAVYVQPFPATGAKYQVAPGGRHPVWSRDGQRLLFVVPGQNRYASVSVTARTAFSFTSPVEATRVFEDGLNEPVRSFDIMADGRLLGVVDSVRTSLGVAAPPQINVVLNWFEELKARLPTK